MFRIFYILSMYPVKPIMCLWTEYFRSWLQMCISVSLFLLVYHLGFSSILNFCTCSYLVHLVIETSTSVPIRILWIFSSSQMSMLFTNTWREYLCICALLKQNMLHIATYYGPMKRHKILRNSIHYYWYINP